MKYDRQKAVNYAHLWWNRRNPKFYNFDNLGGDCTNFISQCLYAGGIEMDFKPNGWFYTSLNNRSPSWSGVDEFYFYSIHNNSSQGVKAKEIEMQQLEIGDVIQLRQNPIDFNHSLFVTKITNVTSPSGIYITCHTKDSNDRKLSDYKFFDIRFLKILN